MQRRQFIRSLAGALLLSPASVEGARQPWPDATPVPTPAHHGLPRPIVLADGIELVDYRIYPSPDVSRIIGEIVSTRDNTVDAPVVSVVFPDLGEDGFAYAPPHLPVMRPGESNLIFGILPPEIDTNVKLASADFGVCGPVVAGEQTQRLRGSDLQPVIDSESYWGDSLNVVGKVTNAGVAAVEYSAVYGLVRDRNGRYVGVTAESQTGNIPPGATRNFFVWASAVTSSPADPYLLLDGATDYAVEPHACSLKPFTLPGCPATLPWNRSNS